MLYHYPTKTQVNSPIPKNKFYQAGNANHKIERLFIEQINQISWAHKLAPTTLNISESEQVKEIQIFHLALKTEQFDKTLLSYIDKLILSPIIFELHYQENIKVIASYKRPNLTDKGKTVMSDYYESDWLNEKQRENLPLFLTMADLYSHLIKQLLPFPPQQGTNIEQELECQQARAQQQKELERLKSKLKKEKQFNRKVEINRQIQLLTQQLSTE